LGVRIAVAHGKGGDLDCEPLGRPKKKKNAIRNGGRHPYETEKKGGQSKREPSPPQRMVKTKRREPKTASRRGKRHRPEGNDMAVLKRPHQWDDQDED